MSTVLFSVAVLSALWGVVNFVRIAAALERRGINVNFALARVFFFRYLSQYKSATISETGKVGPLYRSFVAAMAVALVCTVIGMVLQAR